MRADSGTPVSVGGLEEGMKGLVSKRIVIAIVGLAAAGVAQLAHAQQAQYLEGTPQQEQRTFSPAVITQGGKTVWLAG